MLAPQKGVSVIICCYNSADRLAPTLQHLAGQRVPAGIPWEVVVVDNASTDHTARVASELYQSFKPTAPLRVVAQPLPGQSMAREKGVETARYEYLLFCDDDNWLDEHYVRIAFEVMEANPRVGALGGLGTPVCEVEPPPWFDIFAGNYAVGKQAEKGGDITASKGYVYGAASVFRKSILVRLQENGFRPATVGRTAKGLLCGDDNELGYATVLAGYRIWYDERLSFKHYLPKERLTFDYLKKLHKGIGMSHAVLTPYTLMIKGQKKLYKYQWQWLFLRGLMRLTLKKVDWTLRIEKFPIAACYEIAWVHFRARVLGYFLFRKEINKLTRTLHASGVFEERNH
jgi:glycosyltransferase involved in cell wall biosynthesis